MINDRPASFVNLLTYLNTERALLGTRRRFDVSGLVVLVNMSFSDKDEILMENVYVLKVMEQNILVRNF